MKAINVLERKTIGHNRMAKNNIAEIAGKLVDLLDPLSPEERQRVVAASMTLLGETVPPKFNSENEKDVVDGRGDVSASGRARTWMRQNQLTDDEIQHVFQIENGEFEVLLSDIPGRDKREKTRNAYVLTGAGNLLAQGTASFTDAAARVLCEAAGCYDPGNHTKALKDKGNLFSGSKEKGWTVTGPGLKHAATLIKTIATPEK